MTYCFGCLKRTFFVKVECLQDGHQFAWAKFEYPLCSYHDVQTGKCLVLLSNGRRCRICSNDSTSCEAGLHASEGNCSWCTCFWCACGSIRLIGQFGIFACWVDFWLKDFEMDWFDQEPLWRRFEIWCHLPPSDLVTWIWWTCQTHWGCVDSPVHKELQRSCEVTSWVMAVSRLL